MKSSVSEPLKQQDAQEVKPCKLDVFSRLRVSVPFTLFDRQYHTIPTTLVTSESLKVSVGAFAPVQFTLPTVVELK